jgi:hypothetical protein
MELFHLTKAKKSLGGEEGVIVAYENKRASLIKQCCLSKKAKALPYTKK